MKNLTKTEFCVIMFLMFLAQGYSLFKVISLDLEKQELMKNFFEMMKQNKYSFNDMAILGSQIYSNYENNIMYWLGMFVGLNIITTAGFYFIKKFKQESNEKSN